MLFDSFVCFVVLLSAPKQELCEVEISVARKLPRLLTVHESRVVFNSARSLSPFLMVLFCARASSLLGSVL